MDFYNSIVYLDGFNDFVGPNVGSTSYSDLCYMAVHFGRPTAPPGGPMAAGG